MHIVAYTDAAGRGGAEQTLGTLLAELAGAHDVTVVGPDEGVLAFVAAGTPGARLVEVPPVRGKGDARTIAGLVRTVRRLQPDVVHVNLPTPWHGQYGQLAGISCRGAVTVAVEHSPVPSTDRRQLLTKRWLSARVDAHVACGRWLAREVERLAALPAGRLRVVPNGLPPTPTTGSARPDDWPPGTVVGTVGRLTAEKGFDVLLEALARLPGTVGVIVGTGPEEPALRAKALGLGLADRVVFTGWVHDAAPLLTGFDVFCLPSHREGFPISVLEAMRAGLPVVASDVGGVAESVRHGEDGYLVPPGDVDALAGALGRLVGDPSLREQMGGRGREILEAEFTAATMAARFEALYRELRGC